MKLETIDLYGCSAVLVTCLMEVWDILRSYMSRGSNYSVYDNYGELFIETLIALFVVTYLVLLLHRFTMDRWEKRLDKKKNDKVQDFEQYR